MKRSSASHKRAVFGIGIAGGTCSGKSTLALALAAYFGLENCVLVALDDFYKQQPDEILASGAANFEQPEAFDLESCGDAVQSLYRNQEVRVPEYDRKTSHIQGSRILKPRPILIVEGLFVLFHEKIRQHLDLAIFLETDPTVRISRRLSRDVTEYGLTPERVLDLYEHKVVPAEAKFITPTSVNADLILHGTESVGDLITHIVTRISPDFDPDQNKLNT